MECLWAGCLASIGLERKQSSQVEAQLRVPANFDLAGKKRQRRYSFVGGILFRACRFLKKR